MTGLIHEAPIPTEVKVESKIVQKLRLGRARIRQGWCQEQYFSFSPVEAYCALGALGFPCGNNKLMNDCETALVRAMFSLDPQIDPRMTIPAWNDRGGRKKAEVLALYDRAIELELERATS